MSLINRRRIQCPTALKSRGIGTVALVAVMALIVSACGSSGNADEATDSGPTSSTSDAGTSEVTDPTDAVETSDDQSASTSEETPASDDGDPLADLRAMLPDDVVKAGSISVATNPTYKPYEYLDEDGETLIGQNVDVLEELGLLFDIDIEWVSVADFSAIIPAVASGRYDTAIIFEDLPERQEVVDLIDFYGDALVFIGSNEEEFSDQTACGKSVAVSAGNGPGILAPDLTRILCADKGLPDFEIASIKNQQEQFNALLSGRVDFALTSDMVAKSFNEDHAEFDIRSDVVAKTVRAIPTAKENTELRDALAAGLQVLIDNGTMLEIMERWETQSGFMEKVTINEAPSLEDSVQ